MTDKRILQWDDSGFPEGVDANALAQRAEQEGAAQHWVAALAGTSRGDLETTLAEEQRRMTMLKSTPNPEAGTRILATESRIAAIRFLLADLELVA